MEKKSKHWKKNGSYGSKLIKYLQGACFFFILIAFVGCSSINCIDQRNELALCFNETKLYEHIEILASDDMKGRAAGSPEYLKAVQYVSKFFEDIDLESFDPKAGIVDFTQDIHLIKRKVLESPCLNIHDNKSSMSFIRGNYILQRNGFFGTDKAPLSLVFVGFARDDKISGINDFKDLSLEGKAVIFMNPEPKHIEKLNLSSEVFDRETRTKRIANIEKRNPICIIEIAENGDLNNYPATKCLLSRESYGIDDEESAHLGLLIINKEAVEWIFQDERFKPFKYNKSNLEQYGGFDFFSKEISLEYDIRKKELEKAPNIIALVSGEDPRYRNEYIVIGAHLDHVGEINGRTYNGADDNASGCAAIIEIAKKLKTKDLKRSVIMVLFSAEEKGLLGSRFFIENCPVPLSQIIAMYNLDMIGRTVEKFKDCGAHFIGAIAPKDMILFEDLLKTNAQTVNIPLIRLTEKYGNQLGSDHYHFHKAGIPSLFFFSGEHIDLHTTRDDPEKVDVKKINAITTLVYESVLQKANSINIK